MTIYFLPGENFDVSQVVRDPSSFQLFLTGEVGRALELAKSSSSSHASGSSLVDGMLFGSLILAKPKQLPTSLSRIIAASGLVSGLVCNKGVRHAADTYQKMSQQMPTRDEDSIPSGTSL